MGSDRVVLVTGAAGFIGYHTACTLLAQGVSVVGVDNLSDYYDPALKQARLDRLRAQAGFVFYQADVADHAAMQAIAVAHPTIDGIVHLGAQAGVRHSIEKPYEYIHANVLGHVTVLEMARQLPGLRHVVYASSSSVYGANTALPFSVSDTADHPMSVYGATKRADELLSRAYADLHGIPVTGLRYFTVYGPWGRPDMALWLFTEAILQGRPIRVFNEGRMSRDFTYVDDIVAGTLAALDRPAPPDAFGAPHAVYNLGRGQAEPLMDMIAIIEDALGQPADKILEPLQPGDVVSTHADISCAQQALGYVPAVPLSEGIPRFVSWYRSHHGV